MLQFVDRDLPEIGPDDVLIRVHAAALNPYDWHIVPAAPQRADRAAAISTPTR